MKKILLSISLFLAMSIIASSCSKPVTPPSPSAPASTATTAKPEAAKPSGNASQSTKIAKPGEKAPNLPKKGLPEDKRVAVPADWETVYDELRGYQFEIPQGTQSNFQTVNGVDIYVGQLPAPAKVLVMVVAYRDKTLTKDNLLHDAQSLLEALGEKSIKFGQVQEINEDYDLVELSSVDEKGESTKYKLLMATDVSDNYLVIVGSPGNDYKANEKIIDEIWGSFAMYSGGASGKS